MKTFLPRNWVSVLSASHVGRTDGCLSCYEAQVSVCLSDLSTLGTSILKGTIIFVSRREMFSKYRSDTPHCRCPRDYRYQVPKIVLHTSLQKKNPDQGGKFQRQIRSALTKGRVNAGVASNILIVLGSTACATAGGVELKLCAVYNGGSSQNGEGDEGLLEGHVGKVSSVGN